jgi:hypothetical protein
VPLVQGDTITLQSLWLCQCQQVMSSSVLARRECQYMLATQPRMASLAIPSPHPNGTADAFDVVYATLKHALAWIGLPT